MFEDACDGSVAHGQGQPSYSIEIDHDDRISVDFRAGDDSKLALSLMSHRTIAFDHEYTGYYFNGWGELLKAAGMALLVVTLFAVLVGARRSWRPRLFALILVGTVVWHLMSSQWEGGRINWAYPLIAIVLVAPAMLLWGRYLARPGWRMAARWLTYVVAVGVPILALLGSLVSYDGGDLLYDTATALVLMAVVVSAWLGALQPVSDSER